MAKPKGFIHSYVKKIIFSLSRFRKESYWKLAELTGPHLTQLCRTELNEQEGYGTSKIAGMILRVELY